MEGLPLNKRKYITRWEEQKVNTDENRFIDLVAETCLRGFIFFCDVGRNVIFRSGVEVGQGLGWRLAVRKGRFKIVIVVNRKAYSGCQAVLRST